jgi:hypothetical protein
MSVAKYSLAWILLYNKILLMLRDEQKFVGI